MPATTTESKPAFAPGDVVQLESGGKMMTVANTDGNRVYVDWFDDDGLHQGVLFLRQSLKLADES